MNTEIVKKIMEDTPNPYCRRTFIDPTLCMFCGNRPGENKISRTTIPFELDYIGTRDDKVNATYVYCDNTNCCQQLKEDMGRYLESQLIIPVKYPFGCNRTGIFDNMSQQLHIPSTSKPSMYCGGIDHIIINKKNLETEISTNSSCSVKVEDYLLAHVLMEKGTLQKTISLLDLFRDSEYTTEYMCSKEAARQNRKLLSETKPFLEYFTDEKFEFKLSDNYCELVDYVISTVNKLMFEYKQRV